MTALAGARYRRQSKDKKISLADQEAEGALRFEAEGWALVANLEDGQSASRFAQGDRDSWDELLRLVRERLVGVVWLWEASRGDRKADSWTAFLALCRDKDVRIYIETDERLYNLELPRDMKILANAGVDSEYESALIQARVIRAKNSARREGNLRKVYGGLPPFGWRAGSEGRWAVDAGQAKVLQEAADRIVAGEKILRIHADLDERGLLIDSRGKRMNHKRLRAALTSPLAAGLMTKRDGTPMGVVDGGGPLELAVWERVQADFAGRRRGRPALEGYPLGTLLRCGRCGNQLSGNVGNYSCENAHPAMGIDKPCRGTWASAEEVHAVIAKHLGVWARTSPRAKKLAVADLDAAPRRAALDAEWAQLQQAQADLDYKRDRNRINPADYQRNNDALARDFDRVEAERAALADAEAHPLPVTVDWQAMTADEKRRMTGEVFVTPIVVAPYRALGTRAAVAERIEPGLQLR